ncbi:hypothetical protein BGZ98_003305 [Dissophora globulifera]|nr:hypothetical protein BGZ98_003305 [Dissophora globulifera]
MAITLTFFCVITGDPASSAFPVELPADKTVGDLKDAIVSKSPTAFNNIDAKDLVIWQAIIPDDNQKTVIAIDALDHKEELDKPRRRLGEFFSKSPDDNTYVIVRRPSAGQNRIVVTGTSGIGKSAFLVYFAVRLLSESDGDNPPIIVFHTKRSSTCYVYGGISTVCTGEINEFQALLDLPETWYIVDSSQDPVLGPAKIILSASPKTLVEKYKEVAKETPRYYHMAPWDLPELEKCRAIAKSFNVLKPEFVEMLYVKMGGIPRYVLRSPSIVLQRDPTDIANAENEAYRRVKEAIDRVKEPDMLLECFAHGRDSLEFSSRILHRWPKDKNRECYLAWASPHIQEEIAKQLREKS